MGGSVWEEHYDDDVRVGTRQAYRIRIQRLWLFSDYKLNWTLGMHWTNLCGTDYENETLSEQICCYTYKNDRTGESCKELFRWVKLYARTWSKRKFLPVFAIVSFCLNWTLLSRWSSIQTYMRRSLLHMKSHGWIRMTVIYACLQRMNKISSEP